MKRVAKFTAQNMLKDYPKIDNYIQERVEELTYPVAQRDDNVGGGKSNKISKPQENLVITIDEDKRLNSLRVEKNAVANALDDCDDITIEIVREYFWKKHREKTLEGIAREVGLTRSAIYKRLNNLYKDILKNRGLLEMI